MRVLVAEGVVEGVPLGEIDTLSTDCSSASDSGAPESRLSTVTSFVTGAAAESAAKGVGSPELAAASLKPTMGMEPVSPIVCCRYTTLLTIDTTASALVVSARPSPPPSRRWLVLLYTYTITATESVSVPHCAAESAEQLAVGLQPVHESSAAHLR